LFVVPVVTLVVTGRFRVPNVIIWAPFSTLATLVAGA